MKAKIKDLKMDDCKRKELRDVSINVRVTPSMSKFMKDNGLSPSQIMIQALKVLGYRQ